MREKDLGLPQLVIGSPVVSLESKFYPNKPCSPTLAEIHLLKCVVDSISIPKRLIDYLIEKDFYEEVSLRSNTNTYNYSVEIGSITFRKEAAINSMINYLALGGKKRSFDERVERKRLLQNSIIVFQQFPLFSRN